MHEYQSDFYGHEMRVVVLGYIRPELNYSTRGDDGFMESTEFTLTAVSRPTDSRH